jgi:GntR family histidine utilization transcriptional repressor
MVRPTAPPKPALAPYARVKQHLRDALATGCWPPGTLMPSEAELVAQFGVSRMTVNRALRELQTEGLVERTQGVGTFAAQLGRVASQLTIRDLHEEISERGHQHRSVVHRARAERASAALAAQLGLAAGARVFHTLIVHLENELPLQCEDRYVNPVAAPEYLSVDFTRTTPTHYLLEVAPLWHAQYSIEATRPTAQEARLLGIAVDEPCLVVVRRTVDHQRPITLARLVHPGQRYRLQGAFAP